MRVSSYRPRVFNDAVKACEGQSEDFPKVTPHDLRHTAASLAISAGANVKGVQLMLGHKSAALTLDTYADLFPDDLEAVADALNVAALAAAAYSLRTGEQLRTHCVPESSRGTSRFPGKCPLPAVIPGRGDRI